MCESRKPGRGDHVNRRNVMTRLLFMMFISAAIAFAELILGALTSSLTLATDSVNMFNNTLATIFTYVHLRKEPKKWVKSTFGWARLNTVGTVINSVLTFSLCFHISLKSIKRIIVPENIGDPLWILSFGATSFFVNLVRLFFLRQHVNSSNVNGIYIKDDNMDTAGIIISNSKEVISSLIVIVSALANMYSGWDHRHCFDPLLSLVMVVIIVGSTWSEFRDTSNILLNCIPPNISIDELRTALLTCDKSVCSVPHLEVWTLAGSRTIASCHLSVHSQGEQEWISEKRHTAILNSAKEVLTMRGVEDTTIQIIPYEKSDNLSDI